MTHLPASMTRKHWPHKERKWAVAGFWELSIYFPAKSWILFFLIRMYHAFIKMYLPFHSMIHVTSNTVQRWDRSPPRRPCSVCGVCICFVNTMLAVQYSQSPAHSWIPSCSHELGCGAALTVDTNITQKNGFFKWFCPSQFSRTPPDGIQTTFPLYFAAQNI